jgi:hypothetical protein
MDKDPMDKDPMDKDLLERKAYRHVARVPPDGSLGLQAAGL